MIYKKLGLCIGLIIGLHGCSTELNALTMPQFKLATIAATIGGALAGGTLTTAGLFGLHNDHPRALKVASAIGALLGAVLIGGTTAAALYEKTPPAQLKKTNGRLADIKQYLDEIKHYTFTQKTFEQDQDLLHAINQITIYSDYPVSDAFDLLRGITTNLKNLHMDILTIAKNNRYQEPEITNTCNQINNDIEIRLAHINANAIRLRESYGDRIKAEQKARLESMQQKQLFDAKLNAKLRKVQAAERSADAEYKRAEAEMAHARWGYNYTDHPRRDRFIITRA